MEYLLFDRGILILSYLFILVTETEWLTRLEKIWTLEICLLLENQSIFCHLFPFCILFFVLSFLYLSQHFSFYNYRETCSHVLLTIGGLVCESQLIPQ